MRAFQQAFSTLLIENKFSEALYILNVQFKKPLSDDESNDIKKILLDEMAAHPEEMKILLVTQLNDRTLVELAYINQKLIIVTAIIQAHRAIEDDKEHYGSILLKAAGNKEWALCHLLMNQGASFEWHFIDDASDKIKGRYAVHFFASEGQTDLAAQAIRLGADMTVQTKDGKTPEHLAIEKRNWTLLLSVFIARTKNISLYVELFAEAAKLKEWEFCRVLLQNIDCIVALKNQRVSETETLQVSALYYFAKFGKHALAGKTILGEDFYSDEIPIIEVISRLYSEKNFDGLNDLMCGYRDADISVRQNLSEKLLLTIDAGSHTIYAKALENTNENCLTKYGDIRPNTLDIDWAVCGAIQKNNSDAEVTFLLESEANLVYAWIGAVISGKSDIFEKLKALSINPDASVVATKIQPSGVVVPAITMFQQTQFVTNQDEQVESLRTLNSAIQCNLS